MRKKLLLLLSLLLLVLTLMPSSDVSAASDKKTTKEKVKIEKVIKKFYNSAKKNKPKRMKSCFVNSLNFGAFENMKQLANYCKTRNAKFLKYEIKSVDVTGKKATVKVKCRCRSAYWALYYSFDDLINYMLTNDPYLSGQAMYKKYYQLFKKNLKVYPAEAENITIKFNFVKKNGAWKIKKCTRAIADSITCDYESAYQDYFVTYN